ncbi:MAG: hypothetical protein ACJ74H_03240 [Thermoanaerobaculia bacterium]
MRRQDAAAALTFIGLSLAMTWPLALNLGRAVADPGDPYLTIWILDWDWYATFHAPLSLFHANAFYPAKYSLAFSENLYGLAALLFPLRMFGMDAIAAHNIALLAGFAFSGFGAYILGRRITGSWIAGIAAGVFYAFVPFRFTHLPHVQHIWGGWLPLMLAALLAYAERPTRKRAVVFAAMFVMNGLTNIHYLFFGALATAITAALLLPRSKWRELAMATGVGLLVLAPFLYPYLAVAKLYGMQRTWEEVARFSATASDWMSKPNDEPELRLYPGALAYAAALLALVIARKQKAQIALALLWIAIGFLGSLGLHFVFHEFLFGAVPGFRAVRVPARWAVIAYIGFAILIALVTAAIACRNRWLAWVVPIAFAATLWAGPIRWYLTDPRTPDVHRWLATQRVRAIAEMPIDTGGSEYEYLFRATAHHQRTINGISGFAPPGRVELGAMSNATPIPDAFVDALRESGVELLIVHADPLADRAPIVHEWLRRELERGRLTFVQRFDSLLAGDWVFRIGGPASRRDPRLDAFLAGKETCGEGTMGALDFPPPRFRYGDRTAIFSGWTISPHGIRSVDFWFENRTARHPATLMPDKLLDLRCASTPGLTRTRYLAMLRRRPEGVRRETDVQVEVTDGRGVKTVFDDRWITWE